LGPEVNCFLFALCKGACFSELQARAAVLRKALCVCKSFSRVSWRSASWLGVTCVEDSAWERDYSGNRTATHQPFTCWMVVPRCALLVLLEGSRPISAGGTRYSHLEDESVSPSYKMNVPGAFAALSCPCCFRPGNPLCASPSSSLTAAQKLVALRNLLRRHDLDAYLVKIPKKHHDAAALPTVF